MTRKDSIEKMRDLLTFLLTEPLPPAPIQRRGAPPPRARAEVEAVLRASAASTTFTVATTKPMTILLVAGTILRVRGWTLERLGLRFSWKAALAGVPLALIYLLLFGILATLVQMVVPPSREAFFSFRVTAPFALMFVWLVINSFFEELAVTAYVPGSRPANR